MVVFAVAADAVQPSNASARRGDGGSVVFVLEGEDAVAKRLAQHTGGNGEVAFPQQGRAANGEHTVPSMVTSTPRPVSDRYPVE